MPRQARPALLPRRATRPGGTLAPQHPPQYRAFDARARRGGARFRPVTHAPGSGRDPAPGPSDRYLLPDERKIVTTRKHPAVLRGPAALVIAALAGAALVTAHARTASPTLIAWAGFAATAAWLAWKLIAWQRTYLVVTSHRVMLITGIVNRRIAMMPLAKIADIRVEQPLPGRVLGYGTFLIESAGQGHPLSDIKYVPRPEKICIAITSAMYT